MSGLKRGQFVAVGQEPGEPPPLAGPVPAVATDKLSGMNAR
jgi:hypothetical protein